MSDFDPSEGGSWKHADTFHPDPLVRAETRRIYEEMLNRVNYKDPPRKRLFLLAIYKWSKGYRAGVHREKESKG